FQQRHVVNVLDVDVKRGSPHRIDDNDVEITVVPAEDSGPIFVAEGDLARADHRRPLRSVSNISQVYHAAVSAFKAKIADRYHGSHVISAPQAPRRFQRRSSASRCLDWRRLSS